MSAPRSEALERIVRFFETLGPGDVGRIAELYAPDAFFKDPFNEVRGTGPIGRIFEHMFGQVDAPRFVVLETVEQDRAALIVWDFEFAFRPPLPRGPQRVRGCSHLRFDEAGRVSWHRDYWDAAEELYAKMPVLGGVVRWLRRRAATPGAA